MCHKDPSGRYPLICPIADKREAKPVAEWDPMPGEPIKHDILQGEATAPTSTLKWVGPHQARPGKREAEPEAKWVPMPGEPIKREAKPEWVPMPGEPIKREAEAKWVPMPGEPI